MIPDMVSGRCAICLLGHNDYVSEVHLVSHPQNCKKCDWSAPLHMCLFCQLFLSSLTPKFITNHYVQSAQSKLCCTLRCSGSSRNTLRLPSKQQHRGSPISRSYWCTSTDTHSISRTHSWRHLLIMRHHSQLHITRVAPKLLTVCRVILLGHFTRVCALIVCCKRCR